MNTVNNENTINKEHSVFPPSSAYRYINCPAALVMESVFPSETSEASEEGTAAHALAEWKARRILLGNLSQPRPESSYENAEMDAYTDDYVRYIHQAAGRMTDPSIMIERVVRFDAFVPGGFGTADCIILSDDVIHIIDLKYGRGLVSAVDNTQMKTYALGALQDFGIAYPELKTVRFTIYQPRIKNISTWETSISNLLDWGNQVLKPKGALALSGKGQPCEGDWCKYCKAACCCPLKASSVVDTVSRIDLEKDGKLMSHDDLEKLLPIISNLIPWCESVMAYAEKAAINDGVIWDGFKLVLGKGKRVISSEAMVLEKAKEAEIDPGTLYKTSLKTLTELEKTVGKKMFKEIFSDCVTFKAGSPKLVPESDPGEEYIPNILPCTDSDSSGQAQITA